MNTAENLSGQVSPEQVNAWKEQYGEGRVNMIKCDGKAAYLRTPDRKILSFASKAGTNDPLKFNEVILKECWLGGDEELRDNDDYFLGVSSILSQLIQMKEVELVKL